MIPQFVIILCKLEKIFMVIFSLKAHRLESTKQIDNEFSAKVIGLAQIITQVVPYVYTRCVRKSSIIRYDPLGARECSSVDIVPSEKSVSAK